MTTLSAASSVPLPWQGLLPHEHGTYFQLGLPLATALAVTGASGPALWLAGAAVAGFLAHEPLLLLLGQRGARRLERDGGRAWRWGGLLAVMGALCFVLGVAGMDAAARPFLALPLILAGEVLLLAWGKQERTTSGEVLASLALAAWAVPVAVAGGLPSQAALALWGTFGLAFAQATLAVRLVILAGKPRASRAGPRALGTGLTGLGLVVAVGWALHADVSAWRVAALLPGGLVALALCATLPSPRHLRPIGWGVAAASLLTTVLLGVGLA